MPQFLLKSTAFENGGRIPRPFSCDGKDVSPALFWTGVPEGTASLTLIVNDPDAPRGDWVHWVLFDMPAARRDLPEQVPPGDGIEGGGTHGLNDFGKLGWGGPCPPSGTHRYDFPFLGFLFSGIGKNNSSLGYLFPLHGFDNQTVS